MGARIILILLLLVSGAVVAKLAFFNAPPVEEKAPARAMIIVATSTLSVGALVKPQDLRFAPIPDNVAVDTVFVRSSAPDPADQSAADHKILDEVTGSVARKRLADRKSVV